MKRDLAYWPQSAVESDDKAKNIVYPEIVHHSMGIQNAEDTGSDLSDEG